MLFRSEVIRSGCAIVKTMSEALRAAHAKGKSVTESVIEAERAGKNMGAQEVRTLLSLDGGRTLRPFLLPVEKVVDPLQVYLATRVNGYWADAHVSVSNRPNPIVEKARGILKAVVAAAQPGASAAQLMSVVQQHLDRKSTRLNSSH